MSIVERTIAIIFEGDDRSAAAFGSVSAGLNAIESGVRSVTSPMAELADEILKVQGVLYAISTGALAYSIASFAEFEDVMLKVKGIMGLSEEQYTSLNQLVKDLGATTRYTATEVAQGLEFMALAGFSFEDAMKALPQVLELAQAAALDLGSAADLLTNIMAGYGLGIDQLARVSDTLVATFTNSNTSLTQLGDAFKYVGPVASSLGYELEHTAAILGVLGGAGYQAEQGGTALRNILLTLISPTADASKVFEKLGIDAAALGFNVEKASNVFEAMGVAIKDSSGNLRPMNEILADLNLALQKIPDPADRAALLMELFGKKAGPAMAALLIQGSDSVVELETKILSLGGVTAKIAAEMESGMGGALREIRSAFQAIANEIGEAVSQQIRPAMGEVAGVFYTLAQEVQKGTFDPIFQVLGDFGRDAEAALRAIAQNLPGALSQVEWDGFLDSLERLKDRALALFQAIFPEDLSTADGLADAIQKIVNAWEVLNNVTSGILQAWEPVFNAVGRLIEEFGRAEGPIAKFADEIGRMLGSAQVFDMLIEKFGIVGATAARMVIDGLDPAHEAITDISGASDHANAYLRDSRTLGEQLTDAFARFGGSARAAADGTDSLGASVDRAGGHLEAAAGQAGALAGELNGIPTDKRIQIEAMGVEGVRSMIEQTGYALDQIPEEVITYLAGATDTASWARAWQEIESAFMEDRPVNISAIIGSSVPAAAAYMDDAFEKDYDAGVKATPDAPSLTRTKEQLDVVAQDREAKIQLEVDKLKLDELKAQFDLMGKAVEWKAKLDIAHVEAGAQTMQAAFSTLGAGLQSSADIISAAFGAISSFEGPHSQINTDRAFGIIDREMDLRERMWSKTSELISVQMRYMEALIRRMSRGDALVKVDGAGLQPHLEAFMWEILKEIQVRVNEEGHAMLFGI
jgi:TP901 family phage tail tape measure protein